MYSLYAILLGKNQTASIDYNHDHWTYYFQPHRAKLMAMVKYFCK